MIEMLNICYIKIGIPLATVKSILDDVSALRNDVENEYGKFTDYKSMLRARLLQVRAEVQNQTQSLQELQKKCARLEKENKALRRENDKFR